MAETKGEDLVERDLKGLQPFERHPALASWIERLGNTDIGLSLGEWMVFVGALNTALQSDDERLKAVEGKLAIMSNMEAFNGEQWALCIKERNAAEAKAEALERELAEAKAEADRLREPARLWWQAYQDRCENAYVEQTVRDVEVKAAEARALASERREQEARELAAQALQILPVDGDGRLIEARAMLREIASDVYARRGSASSDVEGGE
jgi:hypothetical protein